MKIKFNQIKTLSFSRVSIVVAVMILFLSLVIISFSLVIIEFLLNQINIEYQISTVSLLLVRQIKWMQSYAVYLLALIILSTIYVPLFLVYQMVKSSGSQIKQMKTDFAIIEKSEKRPLYYTVMLCIAIAIILFIVTYQHSRYRLPISTDAKIYLYILKTITYAGQSLHIWRIINFLPYILTFSMFFPLWACGLTWEFIIKIVPLVFGVMYIFATFYFVKKSTHNEKTAALSSLFASVSLNTLDLSATLFRNFLGLSLFLLFSTCYMLYIVRLKRIYLYLSIILHFFLFFQHTPTAIILMITLVIYNILNLSTRPKSALHVFGTTLQMYLPILVSVLILDLYNFFLFGKFVKPMFEYIPYIIEAGFSKYSFSPMTWITTYQKNWQSIFVENIWLLGLSIIGIVVLCYSHKRHCNEEIKIMESTFNNFILSWVLSVSFVLFFINLEEGYRFALYYPTPIIASIGFFFILEKISSYVKQYSPHMFIQLRARKWIFIIIILLLFMNHAIVRLNCGFYFVPYSIPLEEQNALTWIRDEYYGQNTIIIMKPLGWFNNETTPHYLQWVLYTLLPEVTNTSIYIGDLFDLLSGKSSQEIQILGESPYYSNFDEYKILVIDGQKYGTYYQPDIIERSILVQIHEFIYTVKNVSKEEVQYWNNTWHVYKETGMPPLNEIALKDDSFEAGWVSHGGSLSTDGNIATLVLDSEKADMWIDKTGLSVNSSYYSLLAINANPNGGRIAVDFYGSDNEVIGRYWRFSSSNDWKIHLINIQEITGGKNISRVAIVFLRDNVASSCFIDFIKIFN